MSSIGELEIIVNLVASGVQAGAAEASDSLHSLEESVRALEGTMQKANSHLENMGKQAKDSAGAQAIGFAALAGVAKKYFSIVVGSVQTGIAAYKNYQNAVQGLSSVASYQQIGQSEMLSALDQVKDKFLDVGSASLALKNLLARGYNVDQAVTTIQRLKEAAAFGRQSNLDLAQAVVSATEGIKNENSILIDNAGVTKNIAKMWEEYAKSMGKSTNQLTQNEKIQAEYLGTPCET